MEESRASSGERSIEGSEGRPRRTEGGKSGRGERNEKGEGSKVE